MRANLKAVLRRNLEAALRRGDLEEAEAVLARLKEEAPLAVETRGLELEWLLRSGRLAEAARLAAQLVELFPGSARILFLAGWLAYREKRYAEAESWLEESHRVYPHPRTRRFLGKTLTQMGRLDEAEAVLVPLAESRSHVHLDLAWLYERRGQVARALDHLERFLAVYPDNEFALAQRRRLRGQALTPDELLADVETLVELGEEVPDDLVPQYVTTLLKAGRAADARAFLEAQRGRLTGRLATRVGWECYKLQAHDLALDFFLRVFPENLGNAKFLAALEKAAERCGRAAELVRLYEEHAPREKRLYGRLRRLRARP